MKKMIAMFCRILLLCSMITGTAFDSGPGDGNIDGGGGDMGSGTSSNKWTPGNDGVRITVVNAATGAPVSGPVDFSNKSQPGSVLHFGKVSKINYRNGSRLSLQAGGGYSCIKPTVAMPGIVASGGGNNITEIKKFFCLEYACMMVADAIGVSYEELIGGQYKIVLEPIAYITYRGIYFCMTATEAALYDQMLNGNCPFSGFTAADRRLYYTGGTGKGNLLYYGAGLYGAEYRNTRGNSQVVWVKWHTPDTPQTITIPVTAYLHFRIILKS